MNITKEKVDDLNAVLKIQVKQEDYKDQLTKTLKDIRKKAEVKGFRKGMVPMGYIQKMYGISALVDEVNKIVSENLYTHLTEEKLNTLGEPLPSLTHQSEIDWDKDTDFEFAFDLGMAPEFDLNLSEKDLLPYYEIQVDDEMLKGRVDSFTQNGGEYKEVDAIEDDCMIKATFVELSEGSTKENGLVVEEASFLVNTLKDEKILSDLKSKKLNDTLKVNVKESFKNDSDLSSMLKIEKDAVEALEAEFEITITSISKFEAAALDQALFDQIYGKDNVKSEEEFTAKVKSDLQSELSQESDYKLVLDMKDYMVNKYELSLPAEFLKRWLAATNKELTTETIEKEWPQFAIDLSWQLVKDKVSLLKDVKVEEADLMETAKKVTLGQFRQYGISSLPEAELEKFATQLLENEEQRKKIAENKRDEKIHDAMKELLALDIKSVSVKEFQELVQPTPAIPTEELKIEDANKEE